MYNFCSISAHGRPCRGVGLVEVAAWGGGYLLNYFNFLAGSDMCAQSPSGVIDNDA